MHSAGQFCRSEAEACDQLAVSFVMKGNHTKIWETIMTSGSVHLCARGFDLTPPVLIRWSRVHLSLFWVENMRLLCSITQGDTEVKKSTMYFSFHVLGVCRCYISARRSIIPVKYLSDTRQIQGQWYQKQLRGMQKKITANCVVFQHQDSIGVVKLIFDNFAEWICPFRPANVQEHPRFCGNTHSVQLAFQKDFGHWHAIAGMIYLSAWTRPLIFPQWPSQDDTLLFCHSLFSSLRTEVILLLSLVIICTCCSAEKSATWVSFRLFFLLVNKSFVNVFSTFAMKANLCGNPSRRIAKREDCMKWWQDGDAQVNGKNIQTSDASDHRFRSAQTSVGTQCRPTVAYFQRLHSSFPSWSVRLLFV